jgi:hypothetical protein
MTQKGAIKWANEIKAFQEGKQIQRQTRGVWFDEKSPRFEEDVEYRIKPESPKRLPTIEEVEKWFIENRVFRCKIQSEGLYRIETVSKKAGALVIGGRPTKIREICNDFTNLDGSELYITE